MTLQTVRTQLHWRELLSKDDYVNTAGKRDNTLHTRDHIVQASISVLLRP